MCGVEWTRASCHVHSSGESDIYRIHKKEAVADVLTSEEDRLICR